MRDDKPKECIKNSQRLIAASGGAMITSLIVTPLDVIKIRMQVQKRPLASGDCFIYCNGLTDHLYQCIENGKTVNKPKLWQCPSNQFKNSFDAFYKIVRNEGITSLWSGLSPTLVMAVPQVVIYYTLNDWLKGASGYHQYLLKHIDKSSNSSSFERHDFLPPVCGALSRIVAQSVIAPLELIRTKMQSKQLSINEMRTISVNAVKEGGLSVMWRGMGPTMWRDVPYTVTLWFIYEYLRKSYINYHKLQTPFDIPYLTTFGFSAIGAFFAGIVSHPFDVTKTHRQVELGQAMLYNKPLAPTWSYLKVLRRTKGIKALFSGFGPRMLRVCAATSIMLTIFETTKSMFIKHNHTIMNKCHDSNE